MHETQDTK